MTNYLITGGAGSLGKLLVKELLKPQHQATFIKIFDNNENNLAWLRAEFKDTNIRWVLGDIRDKERITRAMENADVCIHCAAQKHVDIGECNPFESVKTNVLGTWNCIEAALNANIDKFIYISSDKAVSACNTYGRCKALAESLTLDANNNKGERKTRFSICRPPNLYKSNANVTELWRWQVERNLPLTVTDEGMIRYFMDDNQIVAFIFKALEIMTGGEIFVPSNADKIKIIDLAKWFSTNIIITGKRPGERLEEVLIAPSEKERAILQHNMWIIKSGE